MWRGAVLSLGLSAVAGLFAPAAPEHGVSPVDERTCPSSHPVKAEFRPRIRQCVYHMPGGSYYRTTSPHACFAREEDARREGCWRVEEVL